MPWYRFSHTPAAEHRAWIDTGRIGEPPAIEQLVELPDVEAAQAAASDLRNRLVAETGAAWVWVTEVAAPNQGAELPT